MYTKTVLFIIFFSLISFGLIGVVTQSYATFDAYVTTEKCTWKNVGLAYWCANPGGYSGYFCSKQPNTTIKQCAAWELNICTVHSTIFKSSCGSGWCTNAGIPPEEKIANCHYVSKVNSWSSCISGVQVATSVTWSTILGSVCTSVPTSKPCTVVCTANCSCATNTCTGSTCSNGCGGMCNGIKNCTSYSCTGGNPPNGATWCASDDTGLTVNTAWQQVTSCTDARKCEYTMPIVSGLPQCGSANGTTRNYDDEPTESEKCAGGQSSAYWINGPNCGLTYNDSCAEWFCSSSGLGWVRCMTKFYPFDGKCGSASGNSYYDQPATNLCEEGTLYWVDKTASDGTWNWKCSGSWYGIHADCSANKNVVNPTTTTANDATDVGSDGRMIETRP